jgi:hypothetical protein
VVGVAPTRLVRPGTNPSPREQEPPGVGPLSLDPPFEIQDAYPICHSVPRIEEL